MNTPLSPKSTAKIADTAIVNNCHLAEDVQVWHFCNLYGCHIGQASKVG
eukprot:COSAG01_NODE_19411_length_1011_cov_1.119518_1_plen_48_part_10